jgi:DNA-binding MarR family transcriptional regulator
MDTDKLGLGDLSPLGPMEDWPLGRLFLSASRMALPVMGRMVERHGTSSAGFFLLRLLALQDGLRAGEVARRLMTTPATVTSVADTLERHGHVERRRDESDRRVIRLHITESGLAVVTEVGQALRNDDLWAVFTVVDPADEPVVRRYLLTLIQRLDALGGVFGLSEGDGS